MIDRKILGGALLVAGTAIGAGMLALPVTTAGGGFFPAVLIFALCWLFSLATGLLFVEVTAWLPKDANIVTMAYKILGNPGRIFAWIVYLFLFYALSTAYVSGGGGFISSLFGGFSLSWSMVIFTASFGAFIYFGTRWVDSINSLLMFGLIITFILFIGFGMGHVDLARLTRFHWGAAVLALPVMFTSFSYQGVIPSLNAYLDYNPRKVRRAIIIGTTIPFITYCVWELLILGIVPLEGVGGLMEANRQGLSSVAPLKGLLQGKSVALVGQFFAFFALTTSFLGVTLGLLDFLSDSLKVEKKGGRKVGLWLLVYVPPLCISLANPAIFLKALSFAGGFGCVLLLGFLPVMMVYEGRYKKKWTLHPFRLKGGKVMLFFLSLFIAGEIIIEVIHEWM